MRSRCCARYELLISRSVRGSGELPAFLGAQRGVSELLHVAERMPHLDDGHVDVAGEQAYHDGVGVEQHRLADAMKYSCRIIWNPYRTGLCSFLARTTTE